MKGFIEVHSEGQNLFINANSIECVNPSAYGTWIVTRRGEGYPVKEDYNVVKKLMLEALAPTYTIYREVGNADEES